MKRTFMSRKRVKATLTIMVLVLTGLVYAAWTTNGGGTAYSKAGTSSPLTTVDVSATTPATLYPGQNGDVLIKISNPNKFAVRVTGVSLNGTNADIAPDSSHSGCTTTGVSFTNQTGLSIDVPAQSGGTPGTTQTTLTGAASMSNASVDACQGATFSIPVNLTAASN